MEDDENPLLSSMMELEEENARNTALDPPNLYGFHTYSIINGVAGHNTLGSQASSTEGGVELVNSFRSLRESSGISTSNVGDAFSSIEAMPHNKLVKFTKDLFNLIENFSLKHGDMLGTHPMENSCSVADIGHHPVEQFASRGVFVRQHRRGSGDTYRSSASLASIARAPVAQTQQLSKGNDEEGNKTINEYSVIADLGKGAFAKVKLGQNNVTGQTVAIKILKKANLKNARLVQGVSASPQSDYYHKLQREIAIMKKLRHKNIVALYEVIDDPSAEKLYLIMQYVENGPIVRVRSDFTCEPLDEARVLSYLRQLCSALRYLHKHSVVHRDLKPDNILTGNDGTVYVADFGVSEITNSLSHTIRGVQGTPVFLAPEVIREDARADGAAADVWSLGVTLHLMLFGTAPFVGRSFQEISENIQRKPLSLPINDQRTHRWKDILHGLLEKNPGKRMTLSQLKGHKIFAAMPTLDRAVPVTKRELTGALRNCRMFLADDDDEGDATTSTVASSGPLGGSTSSVATAKPSALARRLGPRTLTRLRKYIQHIRVRLAAKPRRAAAAVPPLFVPERAASFNVSASAAPSARVGVRGLLPSAAASPNGQPRPPTLAPTGRQSPATSRLLSSMQEPVNPAAFGAASAGKRHPERATELPQLNLRRGIPVIGGGSGGRRL